MTFHIFLDFPQYRKYNQFHKRHASPQQQAIKNLCEYEKERLQLGKNKIVSVGFISFESVGTM